MQPETMKVVAAALPKVWAEIQQINDKALAGQANISSNDVILPFEIGECMALCPHCSTHASSETEFVYLTSNSTAIQLQRFDCPICARESFILVFTKRFDRSAPEAI
jgi:hypothetical protein